MAQDMYGGYPVQDLCPRCGAPANTHQWPQQDGAPALCSDGIPWRSEVAFHSQLCGVCGGHIGNTYTHPTCTCSTASFATHPRTIGELRVEKLRSAAAWSPRDVLIELLREIDSGEIVPTAMVVTMALTIPGTEGLHHGYRNASPDNFTALGMLTRAIHRLQET